MDILKAESQDLNVLLTVQCLAYQTQAQLTNDFSIPPLTETFEDAQSDLNRLVFLKAVDNGRIVGSVRGRPEGDTCYVGRLFVHPDYQGKGIGTRLLTEIEAACPKPRYELFTSDKSIDNIRLYKKTGYVRFRQDDHPNGYKLVFMEKHSIRSNAHR